MHKSVVVEIQQLLNLAHRIYGWCKSVSLSVNIQSVLERTQRLLISRQSLLCYGVNHSATIHSSLHKISQTQHQRQRAKCWRAMCKCIYTRVKEVEIISTCIILKYYRIIIRYLLSSYIVAEPQVTSLSKIILSSPVWRLEILSCLGGSVTPLRISLDRYWIRKD